MSQWAYVFAAWGLVAAVLVLHAFYTVRKGRKLASQVPPDRRRWIDTEEPAGAG